MKNTTTAPSKGKGSLPVFSKGMSIAILLFVLFVLVGCEQVLNAPSFNNMTAREKNSEIIGEERDKIVGKVSQTIFDAVDRDKSKGQSIGVVDIPKSGKRAFVSEGRYEISTGDSGNVVVYDLQGDPLISEMFDRFYGVDNSVTVNIGREHTIYFDGGIHGAEVRHAETQLSNNLTPGIWEVGIDIEAGAYTVTTEDRLVGYLQIFEPDKEVRVFELVGGGAIQTKSEVQLVDGQILKITGVKQVHFEPVEK